MKRPQVGGSPPKYTVGFSLFKKDSPSIFVVFAFGCTGIVRGIGVVGMWRNDRSILECPVMGECFPFL
jgi:hypothetical protein